MKFGKSAEREGEIRDGKSEENGMMVCVSVTSDRIMMTLDAHVYDWCGVVWYTNESVLLILLTSIGQAAPWVRVWRGRAWSWRGACCNICER